MMHSLSENCFFSSASAKFSSSYGCVCIYNVSVILTKDTGVQDSTTNVQYHVQYTKEYCSYSITTQQHTIPTDHPVKGECGII